jgi:Ferritin-like
LEVSSHIAVAPKQRDLDWIRATLQTAIELEHATLPLYLAAMWSLRVQAYTAYNLIRTVAMEEMVHMAIACNILASIGGRPDIANLDHGFPSQGLPGGAEPDLHARLAQLSRPQPQNFMRVEMPELLLPDEYRDEAYPTIGKLYGAILDAVKQNADAVRAAVKQGGTSNDVPDNIGVVTITTGGDPVAVITAAIGEILEQGEGSLTADDLHAGPEFEGEESHYCKFGELFYGRVWEDQPGVTLSRDTEAQFFSGREIPWPDVMNTLAVPADGYEKLVATDPNAATVEQNLLRFDKAYTGMLNQLDRVWNIQPRIPHGLGDGVLMMSGMRVPATFFITPMQVPPASVAQLEALYPDEYDALAQYTDLDQPVFYGPRFRNLNVHPVPGATPDLAPVAAPG